MARRLLQASTAGRAHRAGDSFHALVVLTTRDLDAKLLREKLAALGVPNLWIPKTIKRVESIPTLASGKLDLTGCKDLALAG